MLRRPRAAGVRCLELWPCLAASARPLVPSRTTTAAITTRVQVKVRSLPRLRNPICMDPPFSYALAPAAETQAVAVSAEVIAENVSAHTSRGAAAGIDPGEATVTRASEPDPLREL